MSVVYDIYLCLIDNVILFQGMLESIIQNIVKELYDN